MPSEQELFGVANFLSAVIGNLANILSTNYAPRKPQSALRITVSLGTDAQLGMKVSNAAGTVTSPLLLLNNGTALVSNRVYTFVVGARSDYRYNFQMSDAELDSGKIQYMTIEEVSAAEL